MQNVLPKMEYLICVWGLIEQKQQQSCAKKTSQMWFQSSHNGHPPAMAFASTGYIALSK
jgi:hypothetical protein